MENGTDCYNFHNFSFFETKTSKIVVFFNEINNVYINLFILRVI